MELRRLGPVGQEKPPVVSEGVTYRLDHRTAFIETVLPAREAGR